MLTSGSLQYAKVCCEIIKQPSGGNTNWNARRGHSNFTTVRHRLHGDGKIIKLEQNLMQSKGVVIDLKGMRLVGLIRYICLQKRKKKEIETNN